MTPTPEHEFRLAAEPLDDLDAAVLAELRGLHSDADPLPGDLLDRIKFTMSVAHLEAQVAEIVSESDLAPVRGTDYDRADTVTFARDGLSVMVTIEHGESPRADVAGWVSESDVEVELRERGRTRTTSTDDDGRFTFTGVERGLASFVLRRRSEPDAPPIITPAIEL
ncbi:carboxypeptidase regulatory-like domain-containing protein [Phycicoccus sp. CSK15P-2]|uniref:carboxypeptidase regulatory-like domain-containing protein n=1 Tax=Phycicoccus sp. CSK15P-2 TaxID=2807627 RepID=UPI00194F4D60|nr:carboxypeptidase regulatory-like domain-containing protein [Phycicoccus sp. CSK15P-2]MBM6403325.1 carboxypeptidase regulatory-like domain-containing protein [Phycicoccus sp. CSK15P-2]